MEKSHDKLAMRLVLILTKLNLGDKLSIDELVEEFGVSKRTIQRDLQERFSYLPMEQQNGLYFLDPAYIGKLNYDDVRNFATLSGIKELYPDLDDVFLTQLINDKYHNIHLIKGYKYEKLSPSQSKSFRDAEKAIKHQLSINFTYHQKQRDINAYRLVNTNGIWYLMGEESEELKTFTFSKITNLKITSKSFEQKSEFVKLIKRNKNTWFSQNSIEVILHVNKEVAEYFLRRELVPYQKILKHSDGGLEIYTKVTYEEEILSIVKYWLPHIKILSPTNLQTKLEKTLKSYLS